MITIDELMTDNPYTLRPTDSLNAARQLMTEKHIRHIPITDDDNSTSTIANHGESSSSG